ncbi:histone-like nucleoid-structuring protein Lsr2 [Propioniciclava soli]|uniref:Lsr2 family protein n=1 Tax=Propioniciclava soli TaxID=2775081 RepID=A0ABZ3CA58_9ACTN|nr:Lsr2 family protein [Propioniciclava soli]
MAQRVHISLTDDLLGDDTVADETLTFGLDNTTYEIDLSSENASQLRDALAPYIAAARKSGSARKAASGGGRRSGRSGGSASANDIRVWARSQGMEVSDRGRVRDDVRQAYEAAHN